VVLEVYFITHITVHAAKRVPRHSLLVKILCCYSSWQQRWGKRIDTLFLSAGGLTVIDVGSWSVKITWVPFGATTCHIPFARNRWHKYVYHCTLASQWTKPLLGVQSTPTAFTKFSECDFQLFSPYGVNGVFLWISISSPGDIPNPWERVCS
jgi:hypothetical protein